MQKAYSPINWENYPSDNTPLNDTNLNKMDAALNEIDNRVVTHETIKANNTDILPMLADVSFDETTGIFVFTRKNGSKVTLDTKLEKLAINWTYDSINQLLIITLEDGTKQEVSLSALITELEFVDSNTVAFFVDETGKVSAIIKEGSIEEKHLQPNYLAEIKRESAAAEASANTATENAVLSESYTHGGTGTRENEDVDNARYYMEQAKQISEIKGGLVPMGTIAFSQLSAQTVEAGYMYNISDEFITDATFKDGAGYTYPAGTNVYLTAEGYWDCLAGSPVTGIKGAAESSYRKGNVNITPANIGLGNVKNFAPEDMPISTATQTVLDSMSEEMASVKKSVSDGKSTIASAITAQGVSTSADATFETMSSNILAIETGIDTSDATAVAGQILKGKTAYVKGAKLTGSMVDYSANIQTVTPTASQIGTVEFDVADGYHTKIKVNSANVYNAGKSAGSNADKTALYNALRYSGLVTSNMTYDEMCNVLAEYFPEMLKLFYNVNYTWGKYEQVNGSVDVGNASMTFTCTNKDYSGAMAFCNTPIPLNNYKTLSITVNVKKSSDNPDDYIPRLIVTKTKPTGVIQKCSDGINVSLNNSGTRTITTDINSLSGNYYICVTNFVATMDVTEIKLLP